MNGPRPWPTSLAWPRRKYVVSGYGLVFGVPAYPQEIPIELHTLEVHASAREGKGPPNHQAMADKMCFDNTKASVDVSGPWLGQQCAPSIEVRT